MPQTEGPGVPQNFDFRISFSLKLSKFNVIFNGSIIDFSDFKEERIIHSKQNGFNYDAVVLAQVVT